MGMEELAMVMDLADEVGSSLLDDFNTTYRLISISRDSCSSIHTLEPLVSLCEAR